MKDGSGVLIAIAVLFLSVLCFGQITKSPRPQPSNLELNSVHSCCSIDVSVEQNAQHLVECVNRSATATTWPLTVKKRIALVTYATPNFYKFSAYTWAAVQAYAEHNGYVLRLADPAINYEPADARWNKVKVVEEALLGWASDCDFIVWLDADLIFMDFGMKLEQVVADNPDAHLWFSTEHFGSTNLVNTGMMMFRNSDFSKWLIKEWWGFANRVYVNDQDQFDLFYAHYKDEMELTEKIIVMPPSALNSEPPASVYQRDYNQILHMISENTMFRVKAFSTAWLEVCHAYKRQNPNPTKNVRIDLKGGGNAAIAVPLAPLRQQLGVNQEHLLAWALLEYQRESAIRLDTYEAVLKLFEEHEGEAMNGEYFHGSEVSGKMNDQTVRYAELLEHISKVWSDDEKKAFAEGRWTRLDEVFYKDEIAYNASTLARRGINDGFTLDPLRKKSVFGKHKESGYDLRVKSFRLLMRNYKVMKRAIKHGYANIPQYDLSMMMFDLINTGKAIAKVIKSVSERIKISDELIKIGNNLLDVIPKERRMNVEDRIAELHVGRGLISKDENDHEEALAHFMTALEMKELVAEQVGDQFLPEILICVADTLCQLGRFRDSWPVFERTVEISARRLGPTSERFAMYSYMAGQSHMAGKDNTGAIPFLRNAIKAFRAQLQPPPGDLDRAVSLLKQATERSKGESKSSIAAAAAASASTPKKTKTTTAKLGRGTSGSGSAAGEGAPGDDDDDEDKDKDNEEEEEEEVIAKKKKKTEKKEDDYSAPFSFPTDTAQKSEKEKNLPYYFPENVPGATKSTPFPNSGGRKKPAGPQRGGGKAKAEETEKENSVRKQRKMMTKREKIQSLFKEEF